MLNNTLQLQFQVAIKHVMCFAYARLNPPAKQQAFLYLVHAPDHALACLESYPSNLVEMVVGHVVQNFHLPDVHDLFHAHLGKSCPLEGYRGYDHDSEEVTGAGRRAPGAASQDAQSIEHRDHTPANSFEAQLPAEQLNMVLCTYQASDRSRFSGVPSLEFA
jgi:hypothetical protein